MTWVPKLPKSEPGGSMDLKRIPLIALATKNEQDLANSEIAGCYFCGTVFPAKEVEIFLADGTGFCPNCGVDSVVADTYKLTPEVLKKLIE